MKLLGAVLLAACLLGTAAGGEQHPWSDEPSRTCFFQMLSSMDREFCRGDLEVIYPELGDVACMYIPKCHQYRRRISREWGSPRVRYPQAEKSKKYVLMLVDPDAPSRANPRNRFWRHWLVTDIPVSPIAVRRGGGSAGASPGTGVRRAVLPRRVGGPRDAPLSGYGGIAAKSRRTSVCERNVNGAGRVDYVRPTPPPRSGYHRYQFRLYQQPADAAIALSPEERVSLGAWAMESFVEQFRLGSPVASTQFLTKYYED
ncbi:PREDICTED: phosphatidylethanolamine-binding protein 4 [Charadrius vociferus]|uniref:phosphatidylethanolamine-binding protein 4 n=1 Tax=Charadrius vociferus TaxID=50402 RepID=UPI00052129A1|nr:PREDICTED: phosphatidylethanolamine-binding protein 4 [Charadrius vociferus]